MKKKRIIALLAALVLSLCLAVTAVADDDIGGNMEGGDGDTGLGQVSTKWAYPWQGVRISVYRISTHRVLATYDYSNLTNDQIDSYVDPDENVTYNMAENWFGYTPKTAYMNGATLTPNSGDYKVRNFRINGQVVQFPNCITSDDRSNYQAVKEFLTRKEVIETLASDFGMAYDDMVCEDIKLIIEPVVYLKYDGAWYAMTATECAVWEESYGPMNLLTTVTEWTLPQSVFLEETDTDVGIAAYTGGGGKQSAATIKNQMGVGIIYFFEEMKENTEECCDCDQWCPCKFDDDGTRRKTECRCLDMTDTHNHVKHIPCDPDYPKYCLCQLGSLTITKLDVVTGSPLSGAEFTLIHTVTGQQLRATTGSDGTVTVKDMHIGVWKVTETVAPDGYVAISGEQQVTVEADQTAALTVVNNTESDIDGDNIIWGYELAKSFTNETNFDKTANWPSLHFPLNYLPICLGKTYYITKSGLQSYEHNDAHLKSYEWDDTITVKRQAYLDSATIFDEADEEYGVMNRYRIMHRVSDSGGIIQSIINMISNVFGGLDLRDYLLRFEEKSGDYEINRETDIFQELQHKTWISHRNGGLSSQSEEIPLAKYMGSTFANQIYKAFYAKYTGLTPTEQNTNNASAAAYATIVNIPTFTVHAATLNDLERDYTGTGCNGGTKSGTDTANASTEPRQDYEYSVEGTYQAKARKLDTSQTATKNERYTLSNGKTYIKQIFLAPSNEFTFYPTYRMWYSLSLGAKTTSTAWMLSAGQRTIRATDAIQVEITGGDTEVWAPWSRDWEDKYTEDSEWGSEEYRDYTVIKAGMVVKAVANPVTIKVTGSFMIQDPEYAPDGMASTVEAKNNAKDAEMTAAVDAIVADLTDVNGLSFGYYSNLWEATSSNVAAMFPSLSVNPIRFSNGVQATSESPKTRLDITDTVDTSVTSTRVCYRGTFDLYTGSYNTITLNGNQYASSNSISRLEAKTKVASTVRSLLNSYSALSGKNSVRTAAASKGEKVNWYEEYYSGIRVCEYTVTIRIGSDSLKTDYVQVHSQLSDSTTKVNELAKALKDPVMQGVTLIPDGMFGIGLCAIQQSDTEIEFGGQTFHRGAIFFPAKLFGVRGSVYDLAQNALQYIIDNAEFDRLL